MDKEQFIQALTEQHIQAAIVDNVPMIFVDYKEYNQNYQLDMDQKIHDMGYTGSYGFKVIRDGAII